MAFIYYAALTLPANGLGGFSEFLLLSNVLLTCDSETDIADYGSFGKVFDDVWIAIPPLESFSAFVGSKSWDIFETISGDWTWAFLNGWSGSSLLPSMFSISFAESCFFIAT